MVLRQEISALVRDEIEVDQYERILEKRNCYPLHSFINKWLMDEYKLDLRDWKESPFGPYICLPCKTIQRFCIALKKRSKGGGYRSYKIWSRPGRKLKVAVRCPKMIPPLVRRELEGRLPHNVLELVGSYVGSRCRYDRMFGVLDQDDWDRYPNEEQEEDVEVLGAALESGKFSNAELYYWASW